MEIPPGHRRHHSRNYLLHLIGKIVVRENEIEVIAKPEFATPTEIRNKNAPL